MRARCWRNVPRARTVYALQSGHGFMEQPGSRTRNLAQNVTRMGSAGQRTVRLLIICWRYPGRN